MNSTLQTKRERLAQLLKSRVVYPKYHIVSFAQQRLWFLDQLDQGSPIYNIPLAVRLRGVLEIETLRRTFNEIVRRHEVLRTTFPARDGKPVQAIAAPAPLPIPIIDLFEVDEGDREATAYRLAMSEAQLGFDLHRGPIIRVKLLRLAPQDQVLLVTIHHIAGDGWSLGVLMNEFTELYLAYQARRTSPLPELPIQYADFSIWQREWLQGSVLEEQLSYWKTRLADAPLSELPTDRPRPKAPRHRGDTIPYSIPSFLARKLNELNRGEGLSLFMTLLAGLQLLVGRYTGQDDVAVGTVIANRNRLKTEGLIGFFVNTLLLLSHLDCSRTVRELLKQVRGTVLDAYAHQDLPFEKLIEELQPERDLTHSPMFRVILVVQNAPHESVGFPGLDVTSFIDHHKISRFDLALYAWETSGGIRGTIDFDTDLFDRSTIERFCERFIVLLEQISSSPDANLSNLTLMTPADRQQVLVAWSGSGQTALVDRCVHRLFEEQAAETPGAVALVYEGQKINYRELNERANQLAHYLQNLGAGPEMRVALCMDRGPEMIIGLLAVLKAGGAYLPLDANYPTERLTFMLEHAQATLLLTQRRLRERLPAEWAQEVIIEDLQDELLNLSRENLLPTARPQNLAYVMYTSGSTGQPKGIAVTHQGIVRLVTNTDYVRISPKDVFLQFAPISFDASTFEIWGALLNGASLVLHPPFVPSLDELGSLIESQKITILWLTAGLFHQMVEHNLAGLRGVRQLLAGGEALSVSHVQRAAQTLSECRLINGYGPTENTTFTSCYIIENPDLLGVSVPIGRPIHQTQVYILNEELEPVPSGIPGELYTGGLGLARGYLNAPGATARKFLPNPYSDLPGARLYATGDRARWRNDGTIEFLGRQDGQVKVRGHRIELGEIEAILSGHRGVERAALMVSEDEAGDRRVVAYIVPRRLPRGDDSRAVEDQVERWQMLFEETYAEQRPQSETMLDLSGWNSSYTGQAIPKDEMQEWVDQTVTRILDCRPRKVLEIGCGTGLLLLRVAPSCDEYWGTDFSPEAIASVRKQLDVIGLPHVQLKRRLADNFTAIPRQTFDMVILNSIVQYFPDVNYLLRVLEGAVDSLAPGGVLFIGDVRSLPLIETFLTSVELAQAPDEFSCDELLQRVELRVRREEELVIDPALFYALPRRFPRIASVRVQPKRGRYHNELSKYRYDVLVHLRREEESSADVEWHDWRQDAWTVARLRRELIKNQPELFALSNIPNARLASDLRAQTLLHSIGCPRTAGQLRDRAAQNETGHHVDPEEIWNLAAELSYQVEISCGQGAGDGSLDAVFQRQIAGRPLHRVRFPISPSRLNLDWDQYVIDRDWDERARQLEPELRSYLQQRLPGYMIPGAFIFLDRLPLTPNGKLDKRSLPKLKQRLHGASSYLAPRTPVEDLLAGLWQEVLQVDRVGIEDNFFALGGHSLLATQVISRLREILRIELPLRALFEAQTLAGFAERVERASRHASGFAAPPLVPVDRDQLSPLSFAQLRLWFIHQLEPGGSAYNIPYAVRIEGELNPQALRRSMSEIVRRHEVLRTNFLLRGDQPVQKIQSPSSVPLPIVDLSVLSYEAAERAAQRLAGDEAMLPFDLSYGPLMRLRLVRLKEHEHVLLATLHHIVSDGWSMGILSRELTALYAAYDAGKLSPLNELPLQYADFAVWQRGWLQGAELERQLEYWREQLAGLEPLELPSDYSRPAVPSRRGRALSFVLSQEMTKSLQVLSRKENATLFMTLLAAWQLLLGRSAGRSDLAVGTDVANRNRREVESLIGFFVNQLVLRSRIDPARSFKELLRVTRDLTLGAYAHQDVPFEKLVEEFALKRDLSRNPLFQVKLVLQNAAREELRLGPLKLRSFDSEVQTIKLDLNLMLEETPDGIAGALFYATDIFDPTTISRLLGHWQVLLGNLVAQPERPVRDLSLLSAAERQQLLEDSNKTQAEFETEEIFETLFELQAARTPDALAVACEGRQISYGALNRRANQLARRLQAMGVGPEVSIAIRLERGLDWIVCLLGVLKAGAAYLPLEPGIPAERVSFILEDLQVPVILTQHSLQDSLPSTWAQIILVDSDWPLIGCENSETLSPIARPENLAYVIYTSGSSGNPKGVGVERRHLAHYLSAIRARLGMGAQSYALISTFAADLGNTVIFPSLASGGCLHVIGSESLLDGSRLAAYFAAQGIDCLKITPSHLAGLLMAAGNNAASLMPRRQLIIGGEACSEKWVREISALRPECRIWNHYGPTECTIGVITYPLPERVGLRERLPLGKPLPKTSAYLLDSEQQPVPVGVAGELYLGGAGVSRGYLSRPMLTAERFVPDPFGSQAGGRLYRTGDQARLLSIGDMEFLGRIDQQVKLRGYRIELGEIEAVLNQLNHVNQAVVTLHEKEGREPQLVAYLVPAIPGLSISTAELRSALKSKLPEYMVPGAFVVREELPVTPNGKIDRRMLPSPDDCDSRPQVRLKPRENIETFIKQVWEEALGVEDIGIRDDFFELGGHSMSAVTMSARLSAVYGEKISVRTIFERPTIEQLAALLRQETPLTISSTVVPIRRRGSRPPLFCVHPADGLVHSYIELARHLGQEQPVYGFQSPGFEEEHPKIRSIEEVAARYVSDLRLIQQAGPYFIVGWSMGGSVAYEMAQQLHRQGEAMALLGFLDTGFLSAPVPDPVTEELIDAEEQGILIREAQRDFKIPEEQMKAFSPDQRTNVFLDAAKTASKIPADLTPEQFRRYLRIASINTLTRARYQPREYPGKVWLFNTETEGFDEERGMKRLALGGTEIYRIPGTHQTMIEDPHVQKLAELLRQCIDAAIGI